MVKLCNVISDRVFSEIKWEMEMEITLLSFEKHISEPKMFAISFYFREVTGDPQLKRKCSILSKNAPRSKYVKAF